jgi:serine/threonine-protein kinase PpkA
MNQALSKNVQIPGYEIKSVLGYGGMSTVYLAVQESLGREVALKVMNTTLVTDAEFQQRFLNEGRIVARLRHPNIVVVYDVGAQGQCYYLSMSYLPGGTLTERISRGLDLDQKVAIMRRIAEGLGYAHDRGIIHRDIKPQNVLFDEDGSPVLTDFGIAKSLVAETHLTTTGMTFGSVPYMSPEQAKSAAVDHLSDLYSLGVVFWEVLTGELPYRADTHLALAFKHATQPIPDLPPALARFQPVLNRLLAKTPEERFASVHEMIDALDRVPGGDDPDATVYGSDFEKTVVDFGAWPGKESSLQTATAPGAPAIEDEPVGKRRLPLLGIAGGGMTVLLLAAAAYFVFRPIGPGLIGGPPYAERPSSASNSVAETGPAAEPRRPVDTPASQESEERPAKPNSSAATAAEEVQGRLAQLQRQAEVQWRAARYTAPPGDNAFETYSNILRLDPANEKARDKLLQIGRIQLGKQSLTEANRLLGQGKLQEALQQAEIGLRVTPGNRELLAVRDRIKKLQHD